MFFASFCSGGLLLVVLTCLFWQWSGMTSLGAFFLLFVGTPGMLLQSVCLYPGRKRGRYTYTAWLLSLGFVLVMGATWLAYFLVTPAAHH